MEFDATEIANLIKTKQLSPKEAVMTAFSEIKTKSPGRSQTLRRSCQTFCGSADFAKKSRSIS